MLQSLPLYQIDAFANRLFEGNPAAVVPLETWLSDDTMQAIAAENQLSETAFFVPQGDDSDGAYRLRWFTPTHEVPLCGHATLAAAFVVFTALEPARETVTFDTRSGPLRVERNGDRLTMTMRLPTRPITPCDPPAALVDGLDAPPRDVLVSGEEDPNYFAVYGSEREVRALSPGLHRLETLHPYGVAVTAAGDEVDFVSRLFAPSYGIPEDPVTGSIHCALAPYWSERLAKTTLRARQLSTRGGELLCEVQERHVLISGQAVQYLEGTISVDVR